MNQTHHHAHPNLLKRRALEVTAFPLLWSPFCKVSAFLPPPLQGEGWGGDGGAPAFPRVDWRFVPQRSFSADPQIFFSELGPGFMHAHTSLLFASARSSRRHASLRA
jgi:hypothetical protein